MMKRVFLSVIQVISYFIAVILVMALVVIPVKILIGDLDSMQPRLELFVMGTMFLSSVFIVNIAMKRLGHSRLSMAGWTDIRAGVRWFGIGSAAGLTMAGGVLLLTWLSGGGTLTVDATRLPDYVKFILALMFGLFITALGEEWIFRGYPLTRTTQVLGRLRANILISLFFMLGHWGGSGWNSQTIINIFLFSLVNGTMRFTPGGIAAAWGFHFTWNTVYVLLGATLTGENFEVPGLRFTSEGPTWLSGGAYGPEGGFATTVVTIIGFLVIIRYFPQQDVIGESSQDSVFQKSEG